MDEYLYAKRAYEAYKKYTGGVSLVSKMPLPKFDDLAREIKEAWRLAADAVLDEYIMD